MLAAMRSRGGKLRRGDFCGRSLSFLVAQSEQLTAWGERRGIGSRGVALQPEQNGLRVLRRDGGVRDARHYQKRDDGGDQ